MPGSLPGNRWECDWGWRPRNASPNSSREALLLTKWQRQHGVVEIDQGQPRQKPNFRYTPLPKTFLGWTAALSYTETRLYLAVLQFTWGYGKAKDAIAQEQLATALGLSRATVQRTVYRLEKRGLVRVTRRRRKISVYEILCPRFLGITAGDA